MGNLLQLKPSLIIKIHLILALHVQAQFLTSHEAAPTTDVAI